MNNLLFSTFLYIFADINTFLIMGKQKYFTEEERKAARKEYDHQKYLKNKEKMLERRKKYYKEHREKELERMKMWEISHKEERKNYQQQHYSENLEYYKDYNKKYYEENRERELERKKQYHSTPNGRANMILHGYRWSDKLYNRGECTLTADWIINNIFSSKCHYCGETDWKELGCDRIDNSKPHTEDNVVCCCEECNKKRNKKEYNEFIKIIKEKI